MEETIPTYSYTNNGDTIILIAENEIDELMKASATKSASDEAGMLKANVAGTNYAITSIEDKPVCIDDSYDAYYLHKLGLSQGDWAYAIHINAHIDNGVNEVNIITNTFTPASMIFN